MAVNSYLLSSEADRDVEEIFDYTFDIFGLDQAVKYLSELEGLLSNLCLNPEIGKTRDEIRDELRSFPYESHIIFYRILPDHIRVVRILHSSRDILKFFE